MRTENNRRAHPLGVIQVKKDSSNKNNAEVGRRNWRCGICSLFLSLETSNGVQSVAEQS